MCGIIGIFNAKNANFKIKKGLKIIKNRGKDNYGIAEEMDFYYSKKIDHLKLHSEKTEKAKKTQTNAIGHCLHSIVSFIPQPLVNNKSKNKLVINCEIYNWKELNKKYNLKARNDAEMMFKLIEKKENLLSRSQRYLKRLMVCLLLLSGM